jgi:hypothetical protein
MATFTIGLTSGPVTGSKNYTLSDADVTRWVAALRTKEAFSDPALTNAQVLGKWADSVMASQKGLVRSHERDVAEKAARAAVTEIGIA